MKIIVFDISARSLGVNYAKALKTTPKSGSPETINKRSQITNVENSKNRMQFQIGTFHLEPAIEFLNANIKAQNLTSK